MKKIQSEERMQRLKVFLNGILPRKQSLYIGIDPGAEGAISFLSGNRSLVIDIPTYKIAVTRTKKLSEDEVERTGKKTRRQQGSATKFDYAGICAIFRELKPFKDRLTAIALEQVPPTVGGPWGVTLGDVKAYAAYMMWPLYLHARGYVVQEVRPNEWKSEYGLAGKAKFDKVKVKKPVAKGKGKPAKPAKAKKGSQTKAKATAAAEARMHASRLFPASAQELVRVQDHNRAEALLIAEFVRRKYKGR